MPNPFLKIDALIETAERPAVNTSREYPRQPNVVVDPNATVGENELLRSFPSVPTADAVPIGAPAPMAPSALSQARPMAPTNPPVDGGNVKTPDIDSSTGYKSSFV